MLHTNRHMFERFRDGLEADTSGEDNLKTYALVEAAYPDLRDRRLIHETVRRMINTLVCDLVETTAANVSRHDPADIDALRRCPPLAAFSPELVEENRELKRFLRVNLYRHYQVLRMTSKARRIIGDLFGAFIADPRLLPPQYQRAENQPRSVADYIAGMTDRYAMKEHRRLFAVGEI